MSDYDDVLLFFQFGSHAKKRTNNLVIGRMYDRHIYDLVEVGVEKFKSLVSFKYDKRVAPCMGSKSFVVFSGEVFETFEELKHLKEVLLDLLLGEIVENLNLSGIDRAYVCTALSPNSVFLMHCALRLILKKSGTIVPRMELVEVGPSMDLVVRRHRLPNDSLKKEAMKTSLEKPRKKEKMSARLQSLERFMFLIRNWVILKLPTRDKGAMRLKCRGNKMGLPRREREESD